jgi:Na+/melibiose symporter-like transporter
LIVSVTTTLFCIIAFFGLGSDSESGIKIKGEKSEFSPEKKKTSWYHNVLSLVSNRDFVLLLIIVFLIGFIGSIFNVYFSVFMANILHGSPIKNGMVGYMNATRLAVEIPVYIFGDRLIGAFGSHGVLLIGMFAATMRPFCYALFVTDASRANYGFFIEMFKGFSHSCNGLGGCVLASDMASTGAQGTAQALFTSSHHHAASVISGLFCSLFLNVYQENEASVIQKIGIYRSLFFWAGFIGLFGIALNCYSIIVYRSRKMDQFK